MEFDSTDRQEELFLALRADGIGYVLPLADVGQIVAAAPESMDVIPLGAEGEAGCTVVFQDDQGLAALAAGRAEGIVRISPACQYEMPEQARSPRNGWIAGVAFLEGSGLYYLLDCRKLRTCAGNRHGE